MSLSINNKTIKSLMKDNKEIVKIERVADGKILYELDVSHSYALSVTASNDIIQSGNTTTLTATLTDNGNPAVGKSIIFKNGSTVLDTVTTNSDGEAEYQYTGTGAGDVTITILYDSLEETYEIEDCLFYDDASIDNRSMYTIYDQYGNANVGTFSYANNQYCHSWSGNYAVLLLIESLGKLSNCEIEVTGKPTSTVFSGTVGIGLQMSGGNSYGIIYYTSQSTRRVKYPWSDSYSAYYNNALEDVGDGYYSLKIYKVGNTITLAKTNKSFTITGDTHYVGIMKGTGANCFKNLKIKALPSCDLSVSASEDIIENGDTTTLTATLTDNSVPVTGETLSYQIEHGNTVISSGSDTTDNNGQISINYTGDGIGDVDVIVSYDNLLQKTYEIQDCYYYNDGSRVSDLEIDSGVSCTSNGDYITITTNTSGEKYVKVPVTVSGNWEFSSEIANIGYFQHITFIFNNTSYWGSINDSAVVIKLNDPSTTQYSHTPSVGDIFKIKYVNGVLSTYINDTQLKTKTVSLSNIKYGFYTNNGRIQHLKNIKVKAL